MFVLLISVAICAKMGVTKRASDVVASWLTA